MRLHLVIAVAVSVALTGCVGGGKVAVRERVVICPTADPRPKDENGDPIVCPFPDTVHSVEDAFLGYHRCRTNYLALQQSVQSCRDEFKPLF